MIADDECAVVAVRLASLYVAVTEAQHQPTLALSWMLCWLVSAMVMSSWVLATTPEGSVN